MKITKKALIAIAANHAVVAARRSGRPLTIDSCWDAIAILHPDDQRRHPLSATDVLRAARKQKAENDRF